MKSSVFGVTFFILLFLGAVVWQAVKPASPSFVVRYRLTLEIDTPQGLRQGSSVIETAVYMSKGKALLSEASGDRVETKGEAVFVDLGNGKNVIALLTSGPKGDWADWHRYFLLGVFSPSREREIRLADLASVSGTVTVDMTTNLRGSPVLPTIITFTDTNDPLSAKVLGSKLDYVQALGEGFAFRRATVEIVPSDTPIAQGIEARLPMILSKLIAQAKIPGQLEYPNDPYKAKSGQFMRGF
jgi:hypothetical protein